MIISMPKKLPYKLASTELLKLIDLDNIQISSYNNFIKNVIGRHMAKTYTEDDFEVTFDKWWIDTSKTLPVSVCKAERKSLEVSLRALMTIKFNNKFTVKSESLPENSITLEVEVTRFPHLTEKGNFIINGVDKVLISHLEKADKLIINPPDSSKEGQFGQLELRSKFGHTLTMDNKILFRGMKRVADNATSFQFDYNQLLQELGYIEDAISSVVGANTFIQTNEENLSLIKAGKSASIFSIMGKFALDLSERQSLNQKTSFSRNLVNKKLAEDITLGGKLYTRGTVVSSDMAHAFQEAGITSVRILEKGIELPVLNNGFVDAENLFTSHGLKVPTDFRIETRNPLNQDEIIYYYMKCNKEEFDRIYKEYIYDMDSLKNQIRLNMDKLLGTCLVKNDLTSMINLFSKCVSKFTEFDDIDNLENKKVVNIADIFEKGLISAISGSGKSGDSYSILGKIKKTKSDLVNTTNSSDSGSTLLMKMQLSLDCGERTITKATSNLSIFNVEDSTNPLAQINHKRKITLMYVEGLGGIKAMSPGTNARSVNPSYAGRIDCIETPESQAVGLVRQIGTLAYLNEFGQLEAPLFKVDHKNKVIDTSKIYYMDYNEEVSYKRVLSPNIAEKTGIMIYYYSGNELLDYEFLNLPSVEDIDLKIYKKVAKRKLKEKGATRFKIEKHKENWFIDEILTITEGHGKTITGSAADVDFVSCSGEHIFSPVTSAIPFVEFNDATRGMMGSVMSKQAISIWGKQKQLVRTNMAEMIAPTATGVITAPYDLIVTAVDAYGIKVQSLNTDKEEFLPCLRQDRTTKTTLNKSIPIVKVGDTCLKGEIMADSTATCGGELAHGTNALIGICPLDGDNYEDGVLFNERLVKEDIFTSFHIEEVEVKIGAQTVNKAEIIAMGREFEVLNSNKYTNDGIIKRGAEVKPNDILAVKIVERKSKKGKGEPEKVPVIVRYEETVPGTVVAVEPYKEGDETVYTIKVANRLKMGVGDKYTGRHGNKGIVCRILPEEDMPFIQADGRRLDIVINPLGVPSRMNIGQLFDGQGGMAVHDLGMRAIVKILDNFNSDAFKRGLKLAGADKKQLCDGRTGKPFRYKSAVVMPYVEKLEHVVAHKIHARSCKPYTRKRQPTQGKARNGGQRLGEMEFWSFIANECVNLHRELTQFKSDDVENRTLFMDNVGNPDADWNEIANRSQNVPYAFQLSDIYYKSMFNRIAYYDENDNEIDILMSANAKDRNLKKSIEKMRSTMSNNSEEKNLKVKQLSEDTIVDEDFDTEDDGWLDGFNIEDFGIKPASEPVSKLSRMEIPKPVIKHLEEYDVYEEEDITTALDEEDDTEEQDDLNPSLDPDMENDDITGDEFFEGDAEDSQGEDEDSEEDPF